MNNLSGGIPTTNFGEYFPIKIFFRIVAPLEIELHSKNSEKRNSNLRRQANRWNLFGKRRKPEIFLARRSNFHRKMPKSVEECTKIFQNS